MATVIITCATMRLGNVCVMLENNVVKYEELVPRG